MLPERLEWLSRFNNIYQVLVNAAKEDKVDEENFYLTLIDNCKARLLFMNQENMLSKKTK